MRALLLGGTRFVGLRLLRALHAAGHQVTILNRGRRQADLPPGIEKLEADRRDVDGVRRVLQSRARDFDVVFDATGYQRPNLEPVVEVLGEHIKRYVFISSFAVYARDAELSHPRGLPRWSSRARRPAGSTPTAPTRCAASAICSRCTASAGCRP